VWPLVFLYSVGSLYGCLSVSDFYIYSLNFDARKKKIGTFDKGIACQLNFYLRAELLIFAVFSMIVDARKKIISASDRVIPC